MHSILLLLFLFSSQKSHDLAFLLLFDKAESFGCTIHKFQNNISCKKIFHIDLFY